MWESMVMMLVAAFQGGSVVMQWQGAAGGREEAATLVIKDQRAWIDLWAEMRREPPQPALDDKHIAVAVFSGTKSTGGHAVSIRSSRVESGHLLVEYVETGPARGQMVTQILTHPWAVAILPASTLPVVFKKVSN
jgi:hypothetical protein